MFELSQKYTMTTTEPRRIILEAAGESFLSKGEYARMGIFTAFFLSSLGPILISIARLDNSVFKKATGWVGIIGMAFLITHTIGTTLIQISGILSLL